MEDSHQSQSPAFFVCPKKLNESTLDVRGKVEISRQLFLFKRKSKWKRPTSYYSYICLPCCLHPLMEGFVVVKTPPV